MPVPLRLLRVEMAVSLMVAVTTPDVWASMLLAWATVALPLFTLTTTAEPESIVAALIAVSIAAAVPVRVPTEPAFTVTVVLPSRVLRAAASTDESVTEMV